MLDWFQRLFKQHNYPEVVQIKQLYGGDINLVYKVETSQGTYCIKVSKEIKDAEIFALEKKSLNFLVDTADVNVPQLYLTEIFEGLSFLMMTYIPETNKLASESFWKYLSQQVEQLHATKKEQFGLDFTTFIGPYKQDNSWKNSWAEFYIENRLEPQIKRSFDGGLLNKKLVGNMERFFGELPSFYPIEKASLLHGDLWSGNVLKSSDYRSFFIDPAIYFGHREMDIAMMSLFGGFDPLFFESYQHNLPMDKGWRERLPFGQLYPLLVHLNLFGNSYFPAIEKILKPF